LSFSSCNLLFSSILYLIVETLLFIFVLLSLISDLISSSFLIVARFFSTKVLYKVILSLSIEGNRELYNFFSKSSNLFILLSQDNSIDSLSFL